MLIFTAESLLITCSQLSASLATGVWREMGVRRKSKQAVQPTKRVFCHMIKARSQFIEAVRNYIMQNLFR